ncbi:hypothetical protein CCACVL1_04746 [Corchorus capsularis]|uniref:Rhodanese domain-containing protein n=1 Tax=Corchorus capsularis TaxID=210143 RepID=A0A1R3JQC4_COCAP|nr:hypothetical protein CCACVL1_04746 [Corchorus capsularis]
MRGGCAVSTTLNSTLYPFSNSNAKPAFPACFHFRYDFPKKLLVIKSNRKAVTSIHCSASNDDTNSKFRAAQVENFVVVNFYRFVFIKDPLHEVAKHRSFLEGLNIHGRIYINEQGINAQYSGPSEDAFAYIEWLKKDEKFSDILIQTSPALNGHAFPKLKLRYKPSLVQFEGGVSHLPLLDPVMRATALAPSEWRKRLEAVNNNDQPSNSNPSSDFILLDVRNGYEWDVGHFQGAQRPDVDCFRSTSFGLSSTEDVSSDLLSNVDKEKTDIMMYCTGGIRCDVYSTILRKQGFRNLYTLKGGISNYLKTEGPIKWVGNLFTFDSRLSLPPSAFHQTRIEASTTQQDFQNDKFAKCYVCGSDVSELRHRNCANLDCNLLFLKPQ